MSQVSTVFYRFIIAFAFLGSALTSCDKEDEPKKKESPKLPPTHVLLETFGQFNTDKDSLDSNFQFAADQVDLWNSFLTEGLKIPITSWIEIRDEIPRWDADAEAWIWNAEYNDTEGNYTANLHGWKDDKHYKWRMYITHQGFFKDFLWFTGSSKVDSTHGVWRVYESYNVDEPYIDIEWWNRENSNLDSIKYTRVGPFDVRTGSNMKFGRYENFSEEDEVYFDIIDALYGQNVSIWMNEESEEGGVKSVSHFGSGQYNCWGAEGQNVLCDTLM